MMLRIANSAEMSQYCVIMPKHIPLFLKKSFYIRLWYNKHLEILTYMEYVEAI